MKRERESERERKRKREGEGDKMGCKKKNYINNNNSKKRRTFEILFEKATFTDTHKHTLTYKCICNEVTPKDISDISLII